MDEFHITTSPQIDLPGDKLPSTLVELLYFYSNKILRSIVFFIRITFRRIYLNRKRSYMTGYLFIRLIDAQESLVLFCLFIRGKHPVCGERLFCSQRTPTACPYCAGSISTIGLRSFLLKVSGVSSHLSFCCTYLVSGFIIHAEGAAVYSLFAQ